MLILFFKTFLLFLLSTGCNCSSSAPEKECNTFTFTVADVGQGLSQIGTKDNKAVVWDMGPPSSINSWNKTYDFLGRPYIDMIVISHDDLDHTGGLYNFPETADFSGKILCSPYSDTAMIRECSEHRIENISFETISENDSIVCFENIIIECIWPPERKYLPDRFKNIADRNILSLCFRIEYKHSSILITSDIDTSVCKHLSNKYGWFLNSDIFMIPHHGSFTSLCPVSYGYINPAVSIVSCGRTNDYGHPSPEVIKYLAIQMESKIFDTRYDGSVFSQSNGEYWSFTCSRN